MVRYVKNNDQNKVVEAPYFIVKDGQEIYGYNKQSNETMLFADGYLKYTGFYPVSQLKIVDGVIVQPIIPVPEPEERTIYTKLQIRRAMRQLEKEFILDTLLSTNMNFYHDWNDAQEIDLNDEVFGQAVTSLPGSDVLIADIKKILDGDNQ